MGISSALNAGVMGLNVNGSKLAAISDNIANSETKGYKRADVEFSSLVLTERVTSYDAGGVRATPTRAVDNRGALLSTRNATDLAISGGGFLPVTDAAKIGGDYPLKLTTTGAFRADAEGVLRTSNGLALLGWKADPNGQITIPSRESSAALVPVQIENLALAADPTTRIKLGYNLPSQATEFPAVPETFTVPVEYFDSVGNSTSISGEFTSVPPAVAGPRSNAWTFNITDAASGGATVYTADIVFDDSPGNGGQLLSVTQTFPAGPALYDPLTGVTPITVNGGAIIDLNIGALNTTDGLQQLASEFQPVDVEKNGSPASPLTSINIDENGILTAVFNSGFTRTLYQIPVAQVPNPNGMRALDNQSFAITRQSGGVYFYDAGKGPTGNIVSSALEESTADIAEELTQLIKTQRAYSSNAKVIQTVDEMLQETTNIKR